MSLLKISSLINDIEAEDRGEWIEIGSWVGLDPDKPYDAIPLPGKRFRTRSINYHPYKVAAQKLVEDFEAKRKERPDKQIEERVVNAAHGNLIAEHLILEWDGFDEPYSAELSVNLFSSPGADTFRAMALFCARKVGKRKVEFVEDAAKNLGKSRAGR